MRWVMLIVFPVLLLAAGCGANSHTVTLRAQDMRFIRDEIRVRAGQPVTLRLDNRDGFLHSFDQDELGLHVRMPANAIEELVFTPDLPGTYSFYCGAPGHTAAGMVGTLIVDP